MIPERAAHLQYILSGAVLLCALSLPSLSAAQLTAVCGETAGDAQGRPVMLAAVVDDGVFVPATSARADGARIDVDKQGRVVLREFDDGASIGFRATTDRGQMAATCVDQVGVDALRFEEIPALLRAGSGRVKLKLHGRLAGRATLSSNIGSISTRDAATGISVRLNLPPTKTPDLLIVVAHAWEGQRRFAARISLPLVSSVVLPGKSEPRSSVYVAVGKKRFGPVRATRQGRFEVRVELPPGVTSAVGESIDTAGNRSTQNINIPVPEPHRFGPLEAPSQGLPGRKLLAQMVVLRADGKGGTEDTVQFGFAGQPPLPAHSPSGGVYQALLNTPVQPQKQSQIVAILNGRIVARRDLKWISSPPTALELVSVKPPWVLRGASGLRRLARIRVTDYWRRPVPGLLLQAVVDGQPAELEAVQDSLYVLAGAPMGSALLQRVSVHLVGREDCQPEYFRVVTDRAHIQIQDKSGVVCSGAEFFANGKRFFGTAILAQVPGNKSRILLQHSTGVEREIVVVPVTPPMPLVHDVDSDIEPVTGAVLELPVAPTSMGIFVSKAAKGLRVELRDAVGTPVVDRTLSVWPVDGCQAFLPQQSGVWLCAQPTSSQLVFTESNSGVSAMVEVEKIGSGP